ncbi:MAG: hypothetical protein K0R01_1519 [Mycobacterium sp.]|nr:hypothetical protein [Mycobacterium sp.]
MSALDIDGDAARDAAQRELSKPIYPRASLTDRIGDWVDDLIYKLMVEGSSIPGGWITIGVLLAIVAAAIVVAVRMALRTMRTDRGHDATLFGSQELTAAEHRAAADRAAASGEWAVAIRHRLRAVARSLEEGGVLTAVPGRTATELARDASGPFPGLSTELRRAADAFNDVTYGERPGTEAEYRLVADLDDHLGTRASATVESTAGDGERGGWAEVQ